MRSSRLVPLVASALAALLVGVPASADHDGDNGWPNEPSDDVRDAPPDDPRFDRAEADPPFSCQDPGVLDQQWEWFGFPSACAPLAHYRQGPHAGSPQIAGASIDRAWQVSTGRPDVVVAIMDTGIDWDQTELDTKVWLNAGELPAVSDRNGNGVVDVLDLCDDPSARFACGAADALVPDVNPPLPSYGRAETGNGRLDAQDIILAFSDGVDDDGNGYVDDIAGWDFFDDDNDPSDTSSVASARRHGTGRAEEAAGETNNGQGEAGACPDCLIMPVRLWDTFIPDVNHYAAGVVYATDNGAAVTEAAIGTFVDTTFSFDAHEYAWDNGVLPVVVSSDLNTAHHDYPASEEHALWINGHVPDTFGLDDTGVEAAPPSTWFRQANLTQYGARADVGIGGNTGSQATGKASGVVALLVAHARDLAIELTPNELKQIVTMTAEDVLPGNTLGFGVPDPAQEGWDQHFGYGRIHARDAIEAIDVGAIPPEAMIEEPRWFRLLDPSADLVVEAVVAAERSPTPPTWELQAARGVEPTDDEFVVLASGSGPVDGTLATVSGQDLAALFPAGFDFGAPPSDPDQFDVTLRLQVKDGDGRLGESRRMVYLHDDPDALPGWPLDLGPSLVASPRAWDLDVDGDLEVVLADADGVLRVLDADGSEVWRAVSRPHPHVAPHASAPGLERIGVPRSPWLTPLLGDIDDDLSPDLLALDASGTLHRFAADGTPVWSRRIDTTRSAPAQRARSNAVATGFLGSPAMGDIDGDGAMEVVAGDLAGDVWAWTADGAVLDGFPVRLRHDQLVDDGHTPEVDDDYPPKIIVSPVLVDLDPDAPGLEIVVPTNEYLPPSGDTFAAFQDAVSADLRAVVAAIRGVPVTALAEGLGGPDTVTYALRSDGTLVDGWPVRLPTALGNALPLIGPSIQPVAGDLDGDGEVEVFTSAVTGPVVRVAADGSQEQQYASAGPGPASDVIDRGGFVPFLEWPALGDLTGDGVPEALKGALGLNVVANLAVTGNNLPQQHVFQAWDASGEYLPAFPRAIADWEILVAPGAADVGGAASAEALVGNGLYLFDAFAADGSQPEGWPQFTGGWMVTSPTVADLDGDGTVEVMGTTREGYAFAWSTDGLAAENDEWWTFHHDERSTGTYGTDTRPPSPVLDATIDSGVLSFTSPGDDWDVGTASAYQIRTSDRPIATFAAWQAAAPVTGLPSPSSAGGQESITLPADAGRHVAVVAVDEAGNRSALFATDQPGAPSAPHPVPDTPGTGGGSAAVAALAVVAAAVARRSRTPMR